MWLFRKQCTHAVCETCGVHFDPPRGSKYPGLCYEHRKAIEEQDRRVEFVLTWARLNWSKLEEQASADMEAAAVLNIKAMQDGLHQMSHEQNAALARQQAAWTTASWPR